MQHEAVWHGRTSCKACNLPALTHCGFAVSGYGTYWSFLLAALQILQTKFQARANRPDAYFNIIKGLFYKKQASKTSFETA